MLFQKSESQFIEQAINITPCGKNLKHVFPVFLLLRPGKFFNGNIRRISDNNIQPTPGHHIIELNPVIESKLTVMPLKQIFQERVNLCFDFPFFRRTVFAENAFLQGDKFIQPTFIAKVFL